MARFQLKRSTRPPFKGDPVPEDAAPEALERSRWTLKRRSAVIPLLAVAAIGLGLFMMWSFAAATPDVSGLGRTQLSEATTVYAADGQILAKFYDENRSWVPLDSISPNVIHALIDTEDERFYEHSGIDVRRLISSTFKSVSGDVQGGSTITMQLVRNAYPEVANDPMLVRKSKEWVMALKIENEYSKEQILTMYLNTVPFLYNAFGIDAAARTYFSKPADSLGVLEAATLVGMLKGPTLYNPVRNPQFSHDRRNVVLRQMVKGGHLTDAQFAQLSPQKTELAFRPLTHEDNEAPYFAEYVRGWLREWAKGKDRDIYRDGLKVYTTLDLRLQNAADSAVKAVGEDLQAVVDVSWGRRGGFFSSNAEAYHAQREGVTPFAYFWEANPEILDRLIRNDQAYRELRDEGVEEEQALTRLRSDPSFVDSLKKSMSRLESAFVAIDPATGYIKAWVGGRDFSVNKYDQVAQGKRQPGSTFKPFVYYTAMANGYSPESTIRDARMEFIDESTGKVWSPGNFGSESGQMVTLRQALAQSMNTVTAQLVVDVGADKVVENAHKAGIQSELEPYPSIGLGTSPVSLLEMTAAYATLVNNGTYRQPVAILRVEDNDGNVLARFDTQEKEALDPSVSYATIELMQGVVDGGTGQRIRNQYGARGELAGKTGTTQNAADGWFMLAHPNLVMGSWVGFASPLMTFRNNYWGQGAHNALHIVGNFVESVDLPAAEFNPPANYRPPSGNRTPRFLAGGEDENGRAVPGLFKIPRAGAPDSDDDLYVEGLQGRDFEPEPARPRDRREVAEERADQLRRAQAERARRRSEGQTEPAEPASRPERDAEPQRRSEPARTQPPPQAEDSEPATAEDLNERERKNSNLEEVLRKLREQERAARNDDNE